MSDSRAQTNARTPLPRDARPFFNLRAKFVMFFSLILVLACSALSWYFIETRRASMLDELNRLGAILLTSVVNNGQFRYAGLVAEDRATLEQFTQSLIAVDEVIYVVIRGAHGSILAQQNKRGLASSDSRTFAQERRFYPEERMALALYRTTPTTPRITPVALSNDDILVPAVVASDWLWLLLPSQETWYDFALPVLRGPTTDPSLPSVPLELEEGIASVKPRAVQMAQGVVQIGLTDAQVKRTLRELVRNVLILTMLIIVAGILGVHILTMRITTPIRKLASVAQQLAEGETPQPLVPSTHDEIGQLTRTFNAMTQSLHERNAAIAANLETIQKQVGQLTTVHQTSAAVTRTLDLNELMDTVLQLLMVNLGLSRMLLMLRLDESNTASIARVAGVTEDIAQAARQIRVSFKEDDSLMAELFIRAKPVLTKDIETVAHRMQPTTLELARRVGMISFVAVPLQSHNQVLGIVVGDRGSQFCTAEDLEILLTIAGHVATAIDNARTYGRLAHLTQNLEQRIEERTAELARANERLQEHDRRRTMFVSVASHELRTPMTVIRSFADNMLDGVAGALSERQTTYLKRIGHNLNRLTRIINQLLDWSRLDLKKDELHVESLDLRQLSAVVVDSLRTMADEKSLTITINASEAFPTIQGDKDRLEQVLSNLIGNAIKFTPPGGRVSVELEPLPDDVVQVCVADTGCGIPQEHLLHIFDEFSKVPSAIPTSQGAQLGLFITKSFIGMHNGRIWVESAEGIGTRFYLALPCRQARSPIANPQNSSTGNA
jgi:signal transduction histidine kinase